MQTVVPAKLPPRMFFAKLCTLQFILIDLVPNSVS